MPIPTFSDGEKVPLVTSPNAAPSFVFTLIPPRGIPRSKDLIATLRRFAP